MSDCEKISGGRIEKIKWEAYLCISICLVPGLFGHNCRIIDRMHKVYKTGPLLHSGDLWFDLER